MELLVCPRIKINIISFKLSTCPRHLKMSVHVEAVSYTHLIWTQEKWILWLTCDPGLALTGFQTAWPRKLKDH